MSQTENNSSSNTIALTYDSIFLYRETRKATYNRVVYQLNDNKKIFNTVNKLMEIDTVSGIISVDQLSLKRNTIGKSFYLFGQKANLLSFNDLTISKIFNLTKNVLEIL